MTPRRQGLVAEVLSAGVSLAVGVRFLLRAGVSPLVGVVAGVAALGTAVVARESDRESARTSRVAAGVGLVAVSAVGGLAFAATADRVTGGVLAGVALGVLAYRVRDGVTGSLSHG